MSLQQVLMPLPFSAIMLYPKNPERRTFRDFLIQLVYDLGLADLVDVAGEVDHLVGEAPLVWNRLRRFPGTTDLCCPSATTVSPLSLFYDQNFKLHIFISLSYQLRQLFTFRAYHTFEESARKMCKMRTFETIYTNFVQTLAQVRIVGGFPCSYFLNYTNCKQNWINFEGR